MTEPLSVLLLSDGRPGHFNLSEGIVAAAERLRPLAVTRMAIRRGQWPGAVLAAWSNSGLASARLLKLVYGIDAAALPPARLVVSAGGETLAANVACGRRLGAANIFYGSLRRFRADDFALALTSYADDCRHPNQAFALKPSPATSSAWEKRQAAPTPPDAVALLVGGPSGKSQFDERDWQHLIGMVEALAARGHRCLLANSRRTPPSVSDRLAALYRQPHKPIAGFIDSRAPDAPSLATMLARSGRALVTDDSSSMVSEAIAAGLPVVGLRPARQALTVREQGYRHYLAGQGWYASMPLATPADDVLAALAARSPRREDPVAPIAALLAERLPRLFGPDCAAPRNRLR